MYTYCTLTVCAYEGVTCDKALGRVTAINLRDKGLAGTLPRSSLAALTELQLGGNELAGLASLDRVVLDVLVSQAAWASQEQPLRSGPIDAVASLKGLTTLRPGSRSSRRSARGTTFSQDWYVPSSMTMPSLRRVSLTNNLLQAHAHARVRTWSRGRGARPRQQILPSGTRAADRKSVV